MRAAVAGIFHESNSFAPVRTTSSDFEIFRGDEVVAEFAAAQATITGYLDACATADVDVVPLLFANATPSGEVERAAFEELLTEVIDGLTTEGPFDVVLMAQHGAAVVEGLEDADGEILRRVREAVGPDVTIVVTFDMHANVSAGMVEHADVVVVWQTNPHVDASERAAHAAEIGVRAARGEVAPTTALHQAPAALNILMMNTNVEPIASLVGAVAVAADEPGVLSASLALGYPWADVPAMGMSVVVVTDGDADGAQAAADRLGRALMARRDEFDGQGVPVDEAIRRVIATTARPVLLLDVGDNIGGGSPGDSVSLLAEVIRQEASDVFAAIWAPAAVQSCIAAGVGGSVTLDVGASNDPSIGPPLTLSGTVEVLDDGRFEDPGPTHGGRRFFDAGDTALLDIGNGNKVVLTTLPMQSHSQVQLTSLGLDPRSFRGLVLKGVHSPMAGFGPIAADVLLVDTPGCTRADLHGLAYERRRRPMVPFEDVPDA